MHFKKSKKTAPKKKKKNVSNRGGFQIQDKWFHKAKEDGYRARSAYKLLQINEKMNLIKPGMQVLDVASAPGSWMQALNRICGPESLIIGFDLQKIKKFSQKNMQVFQGDIFKKEDAREQINIILDRMESRKKKFELITSDIAPKTTGQSGVDQYASIELNLAILDLAHEFLKPKGTLILKVFVWEDIEDLITPVKQNFKTLRRFKPSACRDRSSEEYFVCIGYNDNQ